MNSFAYEVSQNNVSSFHDNFQRGYSVGQESEGRVLFVGDSVLQNYVVPIVNALDIEQYDQVDVVSRGGCVLLKGVSFLDIFSDISCDDIRDKLYSSDKHYNLVVISQSWSLYDKNILNTIDDGSELYFLKKWDKLLSDTVEYFNNKADKVVIIGAHPFVSGAQAIEPNILLTKSKYLSEIQSLEVVNINYLIDSKVFFQSFVNDKTSILYPYDIWCGDGGACKLHDEDWSFFVDTKHISYAGASFAEKRLNQERMLDLFKD
nr:SGNH hydrolase domain-containing protein [Vibrio sp. S12_S33]